MRKINADKLTDMQISKALLSIILPKGCPEPECVIKVLNLI